MREKFDLYTKLLLEWNEKINLTAITEPSEIATKHYRDSLTCIGSIPDRASVVDVGTGAGFPGIPIKIARPDVSLTLMDALNKRVTFLKEVCAQLGLDADCVHIRAEDAGRDKVYREAFDVAVSRAVARLCVLAEYCLPLVKVGGRMLAMKGKSIDGELSEAAGLIQKLGGRIAEVQLHPIEGTDIVHSIVVIEKVSPTPPQYPRSGKKVGK